MRGLRAASLQCSSFQSQLISPQSFVTQRRHASAAPSRSPSKARPAPAVTSVSSIAKTPLTTTSLLSTLNGPPTTLPPTLSLPARAPNQPFFPKYAFALGKAYATFYKTGVKNIYHNFKASRPIQHTLDKKYSGSLESAISSGFLNRRDFQLLVRNWFDMKRIPIFALVFLVCGEFTPLVVIALTGVVPWTCRIPKQVESDRRKLEKRRAISFRNLTAQPPTSKGVEALERIQLLHISWSLGLSSTVWDWLGGQYPGLPNILLRRKVRRRVQYLEMDDRLIGNGERVREMNTEEVKMALVERGVDVLGKDDTQLRAYLTCWLRSRETAPVERLVLTRPSVWPMRPKT